MVRLLEYLFYFLRSEHREFCSVRSNVRAAAAAKEYLKYFKLVCVLREKIFQKLLLALAALLSFTSSAHPQTITQQITSQTVRVGRISGSRT